MEYRKIKPNNLGKTMAIDHNRLRLEMDKTIREINKNIINAKIPELSLEEIRPSMELTARVRAIYLQEVIDISKVVADSLPSPAQIEQLRNHREMFEELVKGSQALEIAIERGYLDVSTT